MSEDTLCIEYACSSGLLTLKSNISAQDLDYLSLLHSINLLFGLRGPGFIPVLDSSQIWSLHKINILKYNKHVLLILIFSFKFLIYP